MVPVNVARVLDVNEGASDPDGENEEVPEAPSQAPVLNAIPTPAVSSVQPFSIATPAPLPRAAPLSPLSVATPAPLPRATAPTPVSLHMPAGSVHDEKVGEPVEARCIPYCASMRNLCCRSTVSPRMKHESRDICNFIVTFLNTIHWEMQRDPSSWFLATRNNNTYHLVLSCGWVTTKYIGMSVSPENYVLLIKVPKGEPILIFGGWSWMRMPEFPR